MFLQSFHSSYQDSISISAEQGSDFAKSVSNDFNPIHDTASKRLCVPGDLLFALVLQRYGLSKEMSFNFSGMVSADTALCFPTAVGEHFRIIDERDKCYLEVTRGGETAANMGLIEQLVKVYVLFSGQNFPHILVPLMAQEQVMINPERPLVIYDSMSLRLDRLTLTKPTVELAGTSLRVDGKRGEAQLQFRFMDQGRVVGHGVKNLILSGLREYKQDAIDRMVADYLGRTG